MYLSITSCIVSQILIEGITYFCVISTRSRTILIKLNDYSFGVLSVRVFLCIEARLMLASLFSRSLRKRESSMAACPDQCRLNTRHLGGNGITDFHTRGQNIPLGKSWISVVAYIHLSGEACAISLIPLMNMMLSTVHHNYPSRTRLDIKYIYFGYLNRDKRMCSL